MLDAAAGSRERTGAALPAGHPALTLPGIIAALMMVMIPTVGDYVTPKLVGGMDGVMIAKAIQGARSAGPPNWPLGAALALSTYGHRHHGRRAAIVLALLGLKRL